MSKRLPTSAESSRALHLRAEQEQILADYSICVGRDQELELIRDWVKNGRGGFRVITGLAGVGKTAFMRVVRDELSKDKYEVKAYFFRAMTKFDSIECLQEFVKEGDLVKAPAKSVKRVVILDALEESQLRLDSLRWNWGGLGENVFVILSLRAAENDKDLLELPSAIRSAIKRPLSPVESRPRIILANLSKWEDIDLWVRLVAEQKGIVAGQIKGLDSYVELLRNTTKGFPLYLSLLLQDIEREPKMPDITRGSDEYVSAAWEMLCLENKDRSHDLLPLIASAKRELHEREIKAIWESCHVGDRSLDNLTSLPHGVRRWLRMTRTDSGYQVSFAHEVLRDWFRESGSSFGTAYHRANDELKQYAFDHRDWNYSLTYLPEHCAEDADTNRLRELFQDVVFQDRRCALIGFSRFESFIGKAKKQFHDVDPIFDEVEILVSALSDQIAHSGLQSATALAPSTKWGAKVRASATGAGRPWLALTYGRPLLRSLSRLVSPSRLRDTPILVSFADLIVCGRLDGQIEVNRVRTDGSYEVVFESKTNSQVLSVAHMDGRFITGKGDGVLCIWSPEPDGTYLVAFESAKPVQREGEEADAIFSLQCNGDGFIISGHYFGHIRVWEPNEDGLFQVVSEIETPSNVLSLVLCGEHIVSGHDDGQMRSWKTSQDGAYRMDFESQRLGTECLGSIDGKIVSGHRDGRIRVWKLESEGSYSIEFEEETPSPVRSLTSFGGRIFSGHADGAIRVWALDGAGSWQLAFCSERLAQVTSLSDSDGKLVSGHGDGSVRVWESELQGPSRFSQVSRAVGEIAGRFGLEDPLIEFEGQIVNGDKDGLLQVWSLERDGSYSLSFESDPLGTVYCLAKGKAQIISGHRDGFRVWRVNSTNGYSSHIWAFGLSRVLSLAFSDGKIISGHADGRIRVWELLPDDSWRKAFQSEELSDVCAFASENGRIFSGHIDGTIRLWQEDSSGSYSQVHHINLSRPISSLSLLGRYVVSGGLDGKLRVHEYDGNNGFRSVFESGAFSGIESLICTGEQIFTGHYDGCIRLWGPSFAGSYELLLTSPILRPVIGLAFVCGRLVSKHSDGSILVWQLYPGQSASHVPTSVTFASIGALLQKKAEDTTLEFKETLMWDIKQGQYNNERVLDVSKAICAMINRDGGTILIGVADDGNRPIGIGKDLENLKTVDRFQRKLAEPFGQKLSPDPTDLVRVHFEEYRGTLICQVNVKSDRTSMYTLNNKVYVRRDGESREISGRDLALWWSRRQKGHDLTLGTLKHSYSIGVPISKLVE